MPDKNLLIGILLRQGKLKTEDEEILLTTIPSGAPQPPESEALFIEEENWGKMALVTGNLSGGILYRAQVVEILPRLTGALIQKLIEKGVVSLTDIHEHLSELKGDEEEIVEPKKLCALVIGHKKSSPGAVNENSGLHEFDFNEDLAFRIEKKTEKTGIQRVYRRTYKELPSDINTFEPDFVISLHCNAFNTKTSGTEVLYYYKSQNGKKMAEVLQEPLLKHLGLSDRGIRPRTSEDRGGYLLRYTKAPCIIAEPFFIDNDDDLAKAQEDIEGLAAAYAKDIDEISTLI
jgi:N-acetylmuramoyl-L-alanine amidase